MRYIFTLLLAVLFLAGIVHATAQTMQTYTIHDDFTGGDCTLIGQWNNNERICTLTRDISFDITATPAITIKSDHITLDGNGHTLTGASRYGPTGVYASGTTDITIRNIQIETFQHPLHLYGVASSTVASNTLDFITKLQNSRGNIIERNTLRYGYHGLELTYSDSNIIRYNMFEQLARGIRLWSGADNNIIYENTFANSISHAAVQLVGWPIYAVGNTFYNNNFFQPAIQKYSGAAGSIYSLPLNIGGNYWGPCTDDDEDYLCDEAHNTYNGIDAHPYSQSDGWDLYNWTPDIILEEPVSYVIANKPFSIPNATAEDREDGDMSDQVIAKYDHPIDTAATGTTWITYSAVDSGGASAAPRYGAVTVVPNESYVPEFGFPASDDPTLVDVLAPLQSAINWDNDSILSTIGSTYIPNETVRGITSVGMYVYVNDSGNTAARLFGKLNLRIWDITDGRTLISETHLTRDQVPIFAGRPKESYFRFPTSITFEAGRTYYIALQRDVRTVSSLSYGANYSIYRNDNMDLYPNTKYQYCDYDFGHCRGDSKKEVPFALYTDTPIGGIEPEIDPLLLKYAPVLYMHPDENYLPMNVDAFVEHSTLWDSSFIDEVVKAESETDPITLEFIATTTDTSNWYLSFSDGDNAKSFSTTTALSKYKSLVDSGEATTTYYTHKMEDLFIDDDGKVHRYIVLQYWFFYAFNDWAEHGGFNNHEGDWESVFVFLDKDTEEPKYVAFSAHHNDGDSSWNVFQYDSVMRAWDDESIDFEDNSMSSVRSYIALGSHANYPQNLSGEHWTGVRFDYTSTTNPIFFIEANNFYTSSHKLNWVQMFEGLWGADTLEAGGDGPQGPYFTNVAGIKRFQHPVEWAGIDKVYENVLTETTSKPIYLPSQKTVLEFNQILDVGTQIKVSLHDEPISYGDNLADIQLLPHFWDIKTNLENNSFISTTTLTYDTDELVALEIEPQDLFVFYYNPKLNVWERMLSSVNTASNTVAFTTRHFSRFALGAYSNSYFTFDVLRVALQNMGGKDIKLLLTKLNVAERQYDKDNHRAMFEAINFIVRRLQSPNNSRLAGVSWVEYVCSQLISLN